MGHHQSGCGVARDHHQIRPMFRDQLSDQRHDTRDDLVFGVLAVRKIGVVRDIDVVGMRPHPNDLTEYGETSKSGVEHKNCRRV